MRRELQQIKESGKFQKMTVAIRRQSLEGGRKAYTVSLKTILQNTGQRHTRGIHQRDQKGIMENLIYASWSQLTRIKVRTKSGAAIGEDGKTCES